ncbi:DinB family protein [Candidatus Bipolaricaulota bacterium]
MDPTNIASQIRAALRMLRRSIEACPDTLWNREADHNPFWALAYHTLFFAHLYLSASEDAFQPYKRQVNGHLGYGKADLGDWVDLTPADVFTKADVLAYCGHIDDRTEDLVQSTPLDAPSGFHWLKFSRGEAHLYNLRHIQHHVGQLNERLRQEEGIGFGWVFDGR